METIRPRHELSHLAPLDLHQPRRPIPEHHHWDYAAPSSVSAHSRRLHGLFCAGQSMASWSSTPMSPLLVNVSVQPKQIAERDAVHAPTS